VTSKLEADPVETVSGQPFEHFYREQRRSLVTLAYAVSGSRLAAEDLAQEALLAAYENWDAIKSKQEPVAWVRRILLNKATSAYRRRMAEARALARRPQDLDSVPFPEVTGDIDRIWREVRRLPRRQTQVIALVYVEHLTVTEIAATLQCSKESVNTHLRRARATLAHILHLEETNDHHR
jgi:RNA polymerase sigma factor (sigma-70 family)